MISKPPTPVLPASDHPSAPSQTAAYLLRNSPHFRGKLRLRDRFVPGSGLARATIFGLHMELDLADLIQRDMYSGLYEPFETQFVRKFLGPGMTVIDVGANVGYYTWLAASIVGASGRVVAFEPGPYAFERLQCVIRENGLNNVDCHQIALGDRSGRGTLYVPPQVAGNYNPSFSPYDPGMEALDITIERLDDLIDSGDLRKIDLMKVDVEGHELSVFRGATRMIRDKRIGAVLCEFNDGYQAAAGSSCHELERWFAEHHFALAKAFPSKWGPRVHNRLYVAA